MIAFRSSFSATPASSAGSVTGTEPSGAQAGDFLLALCACDRSGGAPGLPSGWTSINGGMTATSFGYRFCWIIRGASAPSLTFTFSGTRYRELYIGCWSGVDAASPIDATGTEVLKPSNPSNPDPPSCTAVDAAALAIAAHVMWGGAPAVGGWTAPTGYTMRAGQGMNGNAGAFADRQLAESGAENPSTFGGTAQSGEDGWAQTITLKPAADAAGTDDGFVRVGGSWVPADRKVRVDGEWV